MSYLVLPDLIFVLWLAVVLAKLDSRQGKDFHRLWTLGLLLIVVEGFARIIYLEAHSPFFHKWSHIIALDAYGFAGVAFLLTTMGRPRFALKGNAYLVLCSIPYLSLITAYGANDRNRSFYFIVSMIGMGASILAVRFFRKPHIHAYIHVLLWLPIIAFSLASQYRYVSYFCLFAIYSAAAIGFYYALPRTRWGRAIVIIGFATWAICFAIHPWVAGSHPQYVPMVSQVWDLEKFVVTFGLLILALEDTSAANEYDALHDSLTGLPNRRLLSDRTEQAFARARRNGTRVVLFNFDLNNFKQINDNWGHETGDLMLREVSKRLRAATRESDTLSRIGGDEFYLLIGDFKGREGDKNDLESITKQCKELVLSIKSEVEHEPCTLVVNGNKIEWKISLSIGFAVYPDEATEMTAFCKIADLAMYKDKQGQQANRVEEASELSQQP